MKVAVVAEKSPRKPVGEVERGMGELEAERCQEFRFLVRLDCLS